MVDDRGVGVTIHRWLVNPNLQDRAIPYLSLSCGARVNPNGQTRNAHDGNIARLGAAAHQLWDPMAWLTTIATSVADVLFVCIRNAGRSNMTTGLLDHAPQGALWGRSAGSEPADRLKPAVVEESAGRRRRNAISGDRRGISVDPGVINVDPRGNWG
jgi:hypothetical protein